MHLLDQINRDDAGPARYGEPAFPYMNQSAQPDVEPIRHVLAAWFGHYPDAERRGLSARM